MYKWRKAIALFNKLDAKLINAFPEYFDGAYNIIDWSALKISSFLLILLRAASSHKSTVDIRWTVFHITKISISLLEIHENISSIGRNMWVACPNIFLIDIQNDINLIIVISQSCDHISVALHLAARHENCFIDSNLSAPWLPTNDCT